MSTRFKSNELTIERAVNGLNRRVQAIPHKLSWSLSSLARQNRLELEGFKDKHKGEACILMANGPSLKKTPLDLFKDKVTFGLNRIYLLFDEMEYETDYLICINKLVLDQFSEDISLTTSTKFVNWELRNKFLNSEKTNFIYSSFFPGQFGKDMSKSVYPAATVTYAALQIIYYMGFETVVIVGLDHSFNFNGNVNETQIRTEEKDSNHFHPNYFPKGSKWETPDLVSSEYFYKIADNQFKEDNRRIVDCTINGQCPVFEKGDLQNFV